MRFWDSSKVFSGFVFVISAKSEAVIFRRPFVVGLYLTIPTLFYLLFYYSFSKIFISLESSVNLIIALRLLLVFPT